MPREVLSLSTPTNLQTMNRNPRSGDLDEMLSAAPPPPPSRRTSDGTNGQSLQLLNQNRKVGTSSARSHSDNHGINERGSADILDTLEDAVHQQALFSLSDTYNDEEIPSSGSQRKRKSSKKKRHQEAKLKDPPQSAKHKNSRRITPEPACVDSQHSKSRSKSGTNRTSRNNFQSSTHSSKRGSSRSGRRSHRSRSSSRDLRRHSSRSRSHSRRRRSSTSRRRRSTSVRDSMRSSKSGRSGKHGRVEKSNQKKESKPTEPKLASTDSEITDGTIQEKLLAMRAGVGVHLDYFVAASSASLSKAASTISPSWTSSQFSTMTPPQGAVNRTLNVAGGHGRPGAVAIPGIHQTRTSTARETDSYDSIDPETFATARLVTPPPVIETACCDVEQGSNSNSTLITAESQTFALVTAEPLEDPSMSSTFQEEYIETDKEQRQATFADLWANPRIRWVLILVGGLSLVAVLMQMLEFLLLAKS